jgi:lipid-binding SYLF domain-containing protein
MTGNSISWTDCQGEKSAKYSAPPYWVDKNNNCQMNAQAFGVEEKDGKYVVADAKEFEKYFPGARKGDEVFFAPVDEGVQITRNGTAIKLISDVGPGGGDVPSGRHIVGHVNSDVVRRIDAAAELLNEVTEAPDNAIPDEVLSAAKCLAVMPTASTADGSGGSRGRGVVTCRTHSGWSAPAPITIAGGNWGLHPKGGHGGLVMAIMNNNGMEQLLSDKFTLGADGTAIAGPVGREASAGTDWKLRAEVLTYSRAQGLFAGVDLNGATISADKDGTKMLYGRSIPLGTILSGGVAPPDASKPFMSAVRGPK